MAGESIFACRYAKHPTVAIGGATHAMVRPSTVSRVNQGAAGTTGRADALITDQNIDVELHGTDVVYCLRSLQHGGVDVDGAAYVRLVPTNVHRVNQGAAGSPGPADALVTNYEQAIEVYSLQYAAVLGLLDDAAATLAIGIEGVAGADQSISITNVYFSEVAGQIEIPAKDGGGKLTATGVRGFVNFGAAEVFGDVITATPTLFTGFLAKIGATAANLVLGTEGAAGTNEKLTIKNVYWTGPIGALEIPAKDVGGNLQPFGIRGLALWGAEDTLSTMIVAAADA